MNLNFNQVLDVDGLSEDCRCLCVAEPVGFTLTEGEGEEPSRLTATLMLRLRAWRPYQLQCVADAFSTKFETEQTPQTVQTESLACTLDETVTLTGSGPLPDAGAKILACFASFGPALLAYRENNWDLTSRVTVTAFGENSLSELESYEKVLELALPLGPELPSDAELIPSAGSVPRTCAVSAQTAHWRSTFPSRQKEPSYSGAETPVWAPSRWESR